MIRASELRIGNYVQLEGLKRPIRVSIIDTTETSTDTKAKPIPLTEEWLVNFGFSREVKVGSEMGTDGVEFRVYHFDVLTFNTNHGWWYKVQRMNDTPLEYVHQLQNFYFALTGKELTLKL